MKVKESNFIKENKPLFKALIGKLLEKYEYASLFAEDSYGKTYSVSKLGTNIQESDLNTHRGFVIKVYDKGTFLEYSDNAIDEKRIDYIVKTIDERITHLYEKGEFNKYKAPEDETVSFDKSADMKIDPEEMGDASIVEYLTKINKGAAKLDERVINCTAMTAYKRMSHLFLSKNKDMTQKFMWTQATVAVYTKRDEEVKRYMKSASVLGGMEVLNILEEALPEVVKCAVELLDSEEITPGEYDCICTPETTGMIVHEAFGHGVEMDMFVKDRAEAKNTIGEMVASELVTMHDGNGIDQTATFFFDDEGTLASDTIIIDHGKLVTGMCDLQSGLALNTKPTGNGRRESYERKAYTRMTNTYFENGTDKLEDMIASIKYGFMLENPMSGMEDPKNWGIQMMVNVAREIKDGKFTGKIFSPIVMTGYVPTLLKSISMVSDEAHYNGSGYCGKGYKEWVKVSDGGAYIKARIRLG